MSGMVKIMSPNDWSFDVQPSELVKVSSRGLIGGDFRDFVKRAGHVFAEEVKNIKVAKDEVPIHLIGLGATEAYGPNRNGDGFTSDTCRRYHDTFRKHARWYRNHKNKDKAKSFGYIKLSAFNEAMKRVELLIMLNATKEAALRNGGLVADEELEKIANGEDMAVSMACPKFGTLVKLRRGFQPVETIRPGDEVLTHRGRYRRVHATIRRTKSQFAKIATEYYGRQVLEFTPEHEFYVARWKDIPQAARRNTLQSKDRTGCSRNFRKKYREQLHAHARWLPCGELQSGDLLLMPIYRGNGQSGIDKTRARLLGYYVAEGSRTGDGYLTYTCNKSNNFPAEVRELVTCPVGENEHSAADKAVNVVVYDKPLTSAVTQAVGCGVRNKVIPQEIYDAATDIKLEFVAAWFNGDGWQDAKGLHWSTCSRGLSLELQMLLASVGVPASVYRIDHVGDLPHGQPRTGDGVEYTVNVSNRYSAMFAGRSKAEVVAVAAAKTTVFITGDYLAIPVKSVEIVEEVAQVCDLSVDEDESFTAFGLAVHNCRVPYDVCGSCGHKARNRSEYCTEDTCIGPHGEKRGGCRYNLTKVAKDGWINYVDNPGPTWFDMSKVPKPADRTAYAHHADYFQKAASWDGPLGGAALAELWGVTAPAGIGGASIYPSQNQLQTVLKLASEMAELERQAQTPAVGFLQSFAPEVQDDADLSLLRGGAEQTKMALAALAEERIVLNARDFLRWQLGENHEKIATLTAQVLANLPGAFKRLETDSNLETLVKTSGFFPAPSASPSQQYWARKQAESLSLALQHVQKRAYRAGLLGVETSALSLQTGRDKMASADEQVEGLVRRYALYKLAFLSAIPSKDQELPLTRMLVLMQNHII